MVFIKNRHRDGIYFLQFLTFYFFMEFEFLPINKMWFCTLWFRTKMLWIFHFFSLVRLWKVVLLLYWLYFRVFEVVYIGTEIWWYVLGKYIIGISIVNGIIFGISIVYGIIFGIIILDLATWQNMFNIWHNIWHIDYTVSLYLA